MQIALFGFLISSCSPFSTSVYSWYEMVKLQDGSILPVKRSVTRSQGQPISLQSITFESESETVTWEDQHKWLIDYSPHILDFVGPDPVIIMPVYRGGPCAEYDYPQEGLVAFRYHQKKWSRMPIQQLPPNLALNLLQSEPHDLEHWPRHQEITITLEIKERLQERFIGGPVQGTPFESLIKYYSNLGPDDSCVTIRPPPDSKRDAARALNDAAVRKAETIQATLESVVTIPQRLSNKERYPKRGVWAGAGLLGNECKGIVERFEPMRETHKDGSMKMLAGYQFYLSNQAAINRQVQMPYMGDQMNRLMCNGNQIFAISRLNTATLIVYQFTNLGELEQVIKVALPDADKIRNDQGWGTIWDVDLLNNELRIVLVDGGGNTSDVLNRQQIYRVQLQ